MAIAMFSDKPVQCVWTIFALILIVSNIANYNIPLKLRSYYMNCTDIFAPSGGHIQRCQSASILMNIQRLCQTVTCHVH